MTATHRIPRHERRAIHAQPSPRRGKPVLCDGGPNDQRIAAYAGKRTVAEYGPADKPLKGEYRLSFRRVKLTNPRTGKERTRYVPVYEWYGGNV